MSTVFLKVLNLSINATWIILAVVIVRLLLKKAPKWISCVLWALVAVRLIFPFSVESVLSLIPSGEVVPTDIVTEARPQVNTGVPIINDAVNPVITSTFAPQAGDSVNPLQVVTAVASVIWLAGVAGMLLYMILSFLVLKRKVRASVPVGKHIMACDDVKSPFILGIFRPVIYVPSGISGENLKMVVAHEMAHMKRKDNWWKPLGFLLLSVYWFNPACWVAYILLSRDIESACDQKVIRDKDKAYLAAYSQALLDLSVPRKSISACPLAFGETGVKGRVKGVLNYKKPAFWIIIVAVIAIMVVAVCFLTNPKKVITGVDSEVTSEETSESIIASENPKESSNEDNFTVTREDLKEGVEILGDIDRNGVQDHIYFGEKDEDESYVFFWDLVFNGEIIYHGENGLRCNFGEVWYLDLDEDGEEEIFVNVYPNVNSMPQMQYVALKKTESGWTELENTDVGYESGDYTNAFPLHVKRGKSDNDVTNVETDSGIYIEISCDGYDGFVAYDVKDYYTKLYNSEDDYMKSVAKDILYSDKYSRPGTEIGGPAAWGVWELFKGSFDGKNCIIARHGIQGPGEKFDIIGTADVYFNYDKNGKIQILNLEFTPNLPLEAD